MAKYNLIKDVQLYIETPDFYNDNDAEGGKYLTVILELMSTYIDNKNDLCKYMESDTLLDETKLDTVNSIIHYFENNILEYNILNIKILFLNIFGVILNSTNINNIFSDIQSTIHKIDIINSSLKHQFSILTGIKPEVDTIGSSNVEHFNITDMIQRDNVKFDILDQYKHNQEIYEKLIKHRNTSQEKYKKLIEHAKSIEHNIEKSDNCKIKQLLKLQQEKILKGTEQVSLFIEKINNKINEYNDNKQQMLEIIISQNLDKSDYFLNLFKNNADEKIMNVN